MVDHFIKKKAHDCPSEHKEEMQQEAYVRILRSYERLDATKGWKSFVFNHCRGAVMDYQKFGKGFAEDRWSLHKKNDKRKSFKMHSRMDFEREDQNLSLDSVMVASGLFASIDELKIDINWSLVSCMAAQDEIIHVFAKYLIGFEVVDLAIFFNLSRARIFQIIELMVARFDEPSLIDDVWFLQTCYAFGLCQKFGMENVDQSSKFLDFKIGWTAAPVDLYSMTPIRLPDFEQLGFQMDSNDA